MGRVLLLGLVIATFILGVACGPAPPPVVDPPVSDWYYPINPKVAL